MSEGILETGQTFGHREGTQQLPYLEEEQTD